MAVGLRSPAATCVSAKPVLTVAAETGGDRLSNNAERSVTEV
jgi:hypothetical protein